MLVAAFSWKSALRVDATGISLGGSPPCRAATAAHVSWAEVQAVVVAPQPAQNLPCIGVLRPPGVARLPGAPTGSAGKAAGRVRVRRPGAPGPRLLAAGRAVSGWRFDLDRLTTAVRHHAPGVAVRDLR
ncbi:hypothetical protein ACFQZ4_00015 [Catellatospora coxensis]